MTKSVDFFETQFVGQVANSQVALNPFETAALPYLQGSVLDFGCGMGNLSIAAARQGCTVLSLDAAPTAIGHLASRAAHEGLAITASVADLRTFDIDGEFDAVVAIGLLMFFGPEAAHRQLAQLQAHIRPGGIAVINVLIVGTTYLQMFDPAEHYLFQRNELHEAFHDWDIVHASFDTFDAPGNTSKCFSTVIARKPVAHAG